MNEWLVTKLLVSKTSKTLQVSYLNRSPEVEGGLLCIEVMSGEQGVGGVHQTASIALSLTHLRTRPGAVIGPVQVPQSSAMLFPSVSFRNNVLSRQSVE